MTKAEIKARENKAKLKIRRGDKVVVIAGKDKGEVGVIIRVITKTNRVLVVKENPENPDQALPVNAQVKHKKARMQGERSARLLMPGPIHISNVMVIDPSSDKATRVGRRLENGKLVRYAKKSGAVIVGAPVVKED